MDKNSSADSPVADSEQPLDLSSDVEFLGSNLVTPIEVSPGICESTFDSEDEDPDRILRVAEKYGYLLTEPNQAKSEEDTGRHQFYEEFDPEFAPFQWDNIKSSLHGFMRVRDFAIEIDIKKFEKKIWSSNLDEITGVDPSQKEINVQSPKDIFKHSEMLEKDKSSEEETESKKDGCTEGETEEETEILTEYKYKGKTKIGKDTVNDIEVDSNHGLNIVRRIAYPKLCQKQFSSEFLSGKCAEDVPVENINISVDHFEFLHKEDSSIEILELFQKQDFHSVALDWEKDPQINKKVPLFVKFLESDHRYQFLENCFTLILSILKNPYFKLELFFVDELRLVKEQLSIAEFLVNCLHSSQILDDKDTFEKLVETVIAFTNKHQSLLVHILEGFGHVIKELLSEQIDDKLAYKIFCKVLDLMTTLGATSIDYCLPQYFKEISRLANDDRNCDMYFHLLNACEISIANTLEKPESSDDLDLDLISDEVDLDSFYTACYNCFRSDLTIRLIPIFKKYENRKNREEHYLFKKYAILPTKDGYMNTEMRFLTNMNKNGAESESSNIPRIKECTFNSAGKVLFSSSNAQLGYLIQEDIHELSVEDLDYMKSVREFPLSYLESVTDRLIMNNYAY